MNRERTHIHTHMQLAKKFLQIFFDACLQCGRQLNVRQRCCECPRQVEEKLTLCHTSHAASAQPHTAAHSTKTCSGTYSQKNYYQRHFVASNTQESKCA